MPVDSELGCGALALVHERPVLAQLAQWRVQHEVAVVGELDAVGALDRETHARGIRARRDDQVVLDAALALVVRDVDAGVRIAAQHARVVRYVGVPTPGLVANEVVGASGQRVQAVRTRAPLRAFEAEPERHPGAGRAARAHQYQPVVGEERGLVTPARDEAHAAVELAEVRLEGKRKAAEPIGREARFRGWARGFGGAGAR
jgi:hypothetical protein